jgi:uncharacterized protein
LQRSILMRLSKRLQKIIKDCIYDSFGDIDIYLFGSRTDDTKKGGDIDLAIDTPVSKEDFKTKKIKFISLLLRQGFDLKIDLVQYNRVNELLSYEIKCAGIKL